MTATREDIEALYENLARPAIEIRNSGEEVQPQVAVAGKAENGVDGVAFFPPDLVQTMFSSPERKGVLGQMLRDILTPGTPAFQGFFDLYGFEPLVTGTVSEAWVVKQPVVPGEVLDTADMVPPSEHPDRVEVIFIGMSTLETSYGGFMEIVDGKVDYQPLNFEGGSEGRLAAHQPATRH